MTTLDILFGAVGLITAVSAVLAVTTQHLVHAARSGWSSPSAPWPAAI
jgi:NADH:ubiquinone oxidoreductase subunit 6 (subunit J)